ncbi:solute carrier family 25 member 44-like [Liolophura sinensis]|uniref:solute carrier family 25 member 44-like n=1 Tax=Liolophura sinensis TaxID=3198878 RepID=UPI0031597407
MQENEIQVIELQMMDRRKYYPLTVLSGFMVRGILYPFSLIKTRLQIQKGHSIYNGTFDAFLKITRNEGFRGLYRGFWVNSVQILPSLGYISTYESTRTFLKEKLHVNNNKIRSFLGGGAASIVGQTMTVPVDIISQHMMLLGSRLQKDGRKSVNTKLASLQTIEVSDEMKRTRLGAVMSIIRNVYKRDGILGFYKGYWVSLVVFAPSSALWWFFYDTYCGVIASFAPLWVPHLVIQCLAAPLGGVSSTLITNPMDVIRARIQVEGTKFGETVRILVKEEGVRLVLKGLSARLVQSISFSFFIILGYESIKRWSLLEEHRSSVRW